MFWGCFACHNDWKAYRHLLNSRQLNFFRTVFRTRNYSPHRTSVVSLWERLLDSLYFFPSQWGFSKSFELSTSYSFLNILQSIKKLLGQKLCDLFVVKSIVVQFLFMTFVEVDHFLIIVSCWLLPHNFFPSFLPTSFYDAFSSVIFTTHFFLLVCNCDTLLVSLFLFLIYVYLYFRKKTNTYCFQNIELQLFVCLPNKKTDTFESSYYVLSWYSNI